ncbi:CDP-diaglycerol-glycerol-3-phosphatidyltransferase [gamma proteobacterium HdN1]|nr:CDP-diaglycerol-glycerol-3-phosphatidyltransferase [gamma proteobacterium HdN1]
MQPPQSSRSLHYTIPNLLTMMRVALIPVVVIVYYIPQSGHYFIAAALFALAGITDWFDGYLARKWEQVTKLGAFLDPVADKLMVASALVILVEAHATPWLALPAVVIISREITISALREWMAELGKRATVAVSFLGKVKTTLQMIAITGLLAKDPMLPDAITVLAYVLLYVSTAITLWTMVIYLKAAWPDLVDH